MARRQGVDKVPFAAATPKGERAHWIVSGRTPGSLLEYVGESAGTEMTGVEWRDNAPFYAVLFIKTTTRGRSAARFIWEDDEGRTYPMFLVDTVETLKHGVDQGGSVAADWMVAKRGENYGVRLAEELLNNDARALSRATIADPTEHGYAWVGTPSGNVKHLIDLSDPEGQATRRYGLCFRTGVVTGEGWVTGEKVDRRKACKTCVERFNWRIESARVEAARIGDMIDDGSDG
ncbi:MAG TPA: hypothetical protein VFU98_19145 [Microlunatus sp.]|nr:hypothetical protein [Microlunatus sp.]